MADALEKEGFWLQQIRTQNVFKQLEQLLRWVHFTGGSAPKNLLSWHIFRECCIRLYASSKIGERSEEPKSKMTKEKFVLIPRSGQDNLNVSVSFQSMQIKSQVILQNENVIQTDINLKYAKSAVGFYRATANPDVQWKLQQIQDASNQCVRAFQILQKGMKKYDDAIANNFSGERIQELILTVLNLVKENIKQVSYLARCSLTSPKRKSLVELCQFQPIKSFNPPLPHDILLSYYIASAKLVCAAYQVVSKVNGVQTVTIYQAETDLPHLVEVLRLLSSSFSVAHDFITTYCMLRKSLA